MRRIKTAHPEKPRDALVLDALVHVSDIAQVNGQTIRVARHDQVAIPVGFIDLSVRLQHKRAMRSVELSRAGIDGSRFDRAGQIIHRQTPRSQRRRVGLDSNCTLHAVNVHLRNAGQDVDALRDDRGRIFVQVPVCQRVGKQA